MEKESEKTGMSLQKKLIYGGVALGVATLVGYLIWRRLKKPITTATIGGAAANKEEKRVENGAVKKEEKEGVVYELTEEDIPNILQKEPDVVIMVYASWCGYCKKMAPEFAKAAQEHNGCTWARLSAEDYPEAAKSLQVESFPTTIHFINGEHVKTIPGAVDAAALLEEVQK